MEQIEMIPKKLRGWVLIFSLISTCSFVLSMKGDVLEFSFEKKNKIYSMYLKSITIRMLHLTMNESHSCKVE